MLIHLVLSLLIAQRDVLVAYVGRDPEQDLSENRFFQENFPLKIVYFFEKNKISTVKFLSSILSNRS